TTTTTTVAPTTTTTVPVPACCPSGGVWSEWTVTGTCATTCGSCNNATRTRMCNSLVDGCPCSGDAADIGPCGIAMCTFPKKTCCFTYVKSLNGNTNAFFCGTGNTPTNPTYNCKTTTTTTVAPTTTTTVPVPACCPSGGVWSEWTVTGACATTCGSCNNATRTRTCNSLVDGCPCSGDAADIGPCGIAMCTFPKKTCCFTYVKSLNGNTNEFFCGTGNTPTNPTYNCKTTTTTTTVAPTTTTTVAAPACCPAGGIWSEWSTTGTCGTTCGSCSNATRTRTCTSMSDGCPCNGASTDSGPCGIGLCPFPSSPKTCCFSYVKSLNNRNGEFFCGMGSVPADPINNCQTTMEPTTASTEGAHFARMASFQPNCCPTGGLWTEWVSSGPCPTTCGSCSLLTRTRTCSSAADGCPCTGAATESGPCGNSLCPWPGTTCCGAYVKSLDYKTSTFYCGMGDDTAPPATTCCPTNSNTYWSAWGEWSNTCLTTGGRTRTRVCSGADKGCNCDGDATETEQCCCPTGGVWSEWTPTSGTCATTCGSCTSVARTRTCSSAQYGCACTGASTDTGPCSRAPCPAGSACCTGFAVMTNPNTGASYCGTVATAVPLSSCCTAANAGTWGTWAAWTGSCTTAPCGLCDKQTRNRVCTPGPIGCPCDGDVTQSQACGSNKLCTFPQKTCCAPYIKSLINNTLVCA
ncbi:hypothetical protein PENTCL1PPCAC_1734, partial [Pristionchus entomophagus]